MRQASAPLVGNRFGVYILPGRIKSPAAGIVEAIEAERIGLASAWLSERFALKESGVLCGAMAQATTTLRITGTVYSHNRHPLTTASLASTMQAISGNRFTLLIARGAPAMFASMSMSDTNHAFVADTIGILRRLWAGERVSYHGVAGNFPEMRLVDLYDGPTPPIVLTAVGPKALALAAVHADGALLHPMLTPEGLGKAARIVRDAAERAGRDPARVRVYCPVVVAADLGPEEEDAVVAGRAVTYFQIETIGKLLCSFNGWDPGVVDRLRALPMFANLGTHGAADQAFVRHQLVEASRVLPREWLRYGAVTGTARQCAARLLEFVAAGADEVVLHGSTSRQLGGVVGELHRMISGSTSIKAC